MSYRVTAVHKRPDNEVTIHNWEYETAWAASTRWNTECKDEATVKAYITDRDGDRPFMYKSKYNKAKEVV